MCTYLFREASFKKKSGGKKAKSPSGPPSKHEEEQEKKPSASEAAAEKGAQDTPAGGFLQGGAAGPGTGESPSVRHSVKLS